MDRALSTHESSCCFWMLNREACYDCKVAAVTCVAALAVIALMSGLLLVLAQQGFNLYGINFLAQMIETQWVYAGLALAGLALLIDTVCIFSLSYHHTDQSSSITEKKLIEKEKNLSPSPLAHPQEFRFQYPQEVGMALIRKKEGNLAALENRAINLLNGEYWPVFALSTENSDCSEVHIAITKNNSGKINYHFFRCEDDADRFTENCQKTNGLQRHNSERYFVICAGIALQEPVYKVMWHKNSRMAHLITFSSEQGVTSQYFHHKRIDLIHREIKKLDRQVEINQERWSKKPFTSSEIDFLHDEVFVSPIEFWSNPGNLQEKQYVVRKRAHCVVFIIKHADRLEVKYYKQGDPKIKEEKSGPLKEYKNISKSQ